MFETGTDNNESFISVGSSNMEVERRFIVLLQTKDFPLLIVEPLHAMIVPHNLMQCHYRSH